MPSIISENDIEKACLEMLEGLGYDVLYGPDISEGGLFSERRYDEAVLASRLASALKRINKDIPDSAIGGAIKKIANPSSQNLPENNRQFHQYITDGVPVEFSAKEGIKTGIVGLIDWGDINNNEFLAVNQFTFIENGVNKRADVVLFVNGLPLVTIELKNPADENATVLSAFNQLQTYKDRIPSLFVFNEILIVSDGIEAKAGTLTSGFERFTAWKGKDDGGRKKPEMETIVKRMLDKEVLMDLIRHFIVFESGKSDDVEGVFLQKKIAAYHQYYAVNKAVNSTAAAVESIDKRAGIVWHTQGSGKSLIMVFYAGKLVMEPAFKNPTIIVLTDRNDLDSQLFDTFSRCSGLLRQKPKQAGSREELKELLKVSSGGIIFTTIQKFFPEEKGLSYPLISERENIIVIADEAHRSQYDFIDGFARHIRSGLPNASFIGFTGTPIEKADRSTPAVFGDYVDIYDVEQAVKDGATVPIYYENRLAKLELKPEERPNINRDFEEVTEGEEAQVKEKLKSEWASAEKIVGNEERIKRIAKDIVKHWELRLETLDGKAIIVCMSRRICVQLHDEIVKLRPAWYDVNDDKGVLKIVMTGNNSDPVPWQEHIRTKDKRNRLGGRLKNPDDSLKIVIVRDMWLTGFDAPPLHTMYIDKPMKGHNLMQAIARVNRVFKDKPGGLIVDYIGIYFELGKALSDYTEGDKKLTGINQEDAVKLMKEKYEVVSALFYGFEYKKYFGLKTNEGLQFILDGTEHILSLENGKNRFLEIIAALSKAFALAVPNEESMKIRDDVGFFQAVRASIIKNTSSDKNEAAVKDYDSAIKQIISKAIVSDRVIDIFAAAGLKKPDISVLSDEFLREIKEMPRKNLAFEALKKLLSDEIKIMRRKNLVQARSFEELLDKAIKAYTNKTIETAEIIERLIEMAKDIREAGKRGEKLSLSDDEIAFYDALETNDSAVKVLGDETLKTIARELVETVHKNVTIDWTKRKSVQASLRIIIRRILKKYGYPPDKQEKATNTVLEAAQNIGSCWVDESFGRVAGSPLPYYDIIDSGDIVESDKFVKYLPVYSLEAAATAFGKEEYVEEAGWMNVDAAIKLTKDMFIARVVGSSMEPTIKDGSYCVFRKERGGSREGLVVLVESRQVADPETNQKFTVKRYHSEKERLPDGTWRHKRIELSPDNKEFQPIILENAAEDDFKVIAEFVAVVY